MNYLILPEHTGNHATITDPVQLKHIHHVLKAKQGDSLKVGVLGGQLGTAIISHIQADRIQFSQINCQQPPPAKLPLTLVVALPRPKVLRRLLLDATALGVAHLVLLHSYKVEKSYWQTPLLQKLDDYMLFGLSQAGDTVMPTLGLKKRFKPFVEDELPALIANKQALVAHPYAVTQLQEVGQTHQETVLVIGAEGGFIDYEVDLLTQQGCLPVSLGRRVLRTEVAISVLCGRLFS